MNEKEIKQYLKEHLKLKHTVVGGKDGIPWHEAYLLMLDDEVISIAEGGVGEALY